MVSPDVHDLDPNRKTNAQLWQSFTWAVAHIKAYREKIRQGDVSIERVDAYAREISYYAEEALCMSEELRSRGFETGWWD